MSSEETRRFCLQLAGAHHHGCSATEIVAAAAIYEAFIWQPRDQREPTPRQIEAGVTVLLRASGWLKDQVNATGLMREILTKAALAEE